MRTMKVRASRADRLMSLVNAAFCALAIIVCLYPFYYVVINSISDPSASANTFLLPVRPTLTTYIKLFEENNIPRAFAVSLLRTFATTVINVLCSSFLAYLFTKDMALKKTVYRLVIVTMYLNAGLIPWYLTMKSYGLKNTFLLYVLPYMLSAYYIILIKTFMEQLPDSLGESAELDGAGSLTIFWRIVFPLSRPILATIAVFCSVSQWNTWQDNYFLVQSDSLQTIQLILYNYLNRARAIAQAIMNNPNANMGLMDAAVSEKSVRMTIVVVSVIPIMCVYPFLQRYFTKGILLGAVKG